MVGGDAPIVVQSMCATRTTDIDETVKQAHQLANAGAGIVRIAVDNDKEAAALKEIRAQTRGVVLSVDLQENYKVADKVAPHVDKIRYNPGHLHHIDKKQDRAGEGQMAGRGGARQRPRDPHRRQLRLGRAGVPREISRRSARGDRRVGRVSLRADGGFWLRSLRRVAQGFRSGQGDGRQPPLRRAASRRAAASGRHRGGFAARRYHQDPHRVREAARGSKSATPSASRSRCPTSASTRRSSSATRSSRTSRPAASSRCRISARASTSSRARRARGSRTSSSSSSRSRSR